MLATTRSTACIAASLIAFGGWAQAEDVDIQTVLDTAMPHMHHICASVLETYSDDDDAVAEIVRQMAFVSFYNRQLDILALVPEQAKREGLKDEFVEELEDFCDDDPGKLLAGAVDMTVKNTTAAYG